MSLIVYRNGMSETTPMEYQNEMGEISPIVYQYEDESNIKRSIRMHGSEMN